MNLSWILIIVYFSIKGAIVNKLEIKQLLKFYGLETEYYMSDGYIYNLEQLINIQAQQIERLQNRLREIEPHKPMNEHHKIRIA